MKKNVLFIAPIMSSLLFFCIETVHADIPGPGPESTWRSEAIDPYALEDEDRESPKTMHGIIGIGILVTVVTSFAVLYRIKNK